MQDQHKDEFVEPQDIIGRYQVLSESNASLREARSKAEKVIDDLNNEIEAFVKEQTTAKVTYNNKIGVQQKALEDFETEKSKLSKDNEENTNNRLKKTSEHGQIIMTIDSLFNKVASRGKDLIASNPYKERPPLKDFNDLGECEKQSDVQLEIIREFVQNFHHFCELLNKPNIQNPTAQVDIDRLLEILEQKHKDEVEDFMQYKK